MVTKVSQLISNSQLPLGAQAVHSAQCSKGRTYKKIDVQLFEFNDIFCILNEILHQK